MKVAFTYSVFNQQVGGVSKYFFEICNRLKLDNELFFLTRYSENIYFNKNLLKINFFLKRFDFPAKKYVIDYLQLRYTKSILKKNVFDLIHHTGDFSSIFDFNIHKLPIVITIHDMQPELYGKQRIRIENRKKCIEYSSAIICVSHNTKNELFKFFPKIDKNKVFVIHHGYDEQKYIYEEKKKDFYILYVGSRYDYKNFIFFLTSISLILIDRNLFLYCVGNSFSNNEKNLIHNLGLNDLVKNIGIVSDFQLANLYHNAACFVYPSLYEGFGIPILEAFKHKCPVALSNTSCFPEIAKDSALYFNPKDSNSIQNTIISAIENRKKLISLGTKRMYDFSWNKAADETLAVYKWAVENHKLKI